MLVQEFRENNDVVDISFREILIWSKQTINLSLNVNERILIFHNDDVKRFLFAMRNYYQLVLIDEINASLIKESEAIDNSNKWAISHY